MIYLFIHLFSSSSEPAFTGSAGVYRCRLNSSASKHSLTNSVVINPASHNKLPCMFLCITLIYLIIKKPK